MTNDLSLHSTPLRRAQARHLHRAHLHALDHGPDPGPARPAAIIHDCLPGDPVWQRARLGKVTASELDHLLTPQFAIRKGEMPHSYLCRKVAERFTGRPLEDEDFGPGDSGEGRALENEARKLFSISFQPPGEPFLEAGFVEHAEGRFGCSPHALIGEDSGLEIKCPKVKTHVKYLLSGTLPPEYAAQVHGALYATGRASWMFMSYARGFPPFILTVRRDERICAAIAEALAGFYEHFDAALDLLHETR